MSEVYECTHISFLLLHNKCPQLQCLKKTHIYFHKLLRVRSSSMAKLDLLLGSHKAQIKVLARLHSYLEFRVLFPAHTGCWQNSVPSGTKMEAVSP